MVPRAEPSVPITATRASPLRLVAARVILAAWWCVVWAWGGAVCARAQGNAAQAGYVYPAGARQGATVTVVAGGRQLQAVEAALVSGEGVEARVLGVERPMPQEERTRLRDELTALRRPRGGANPTPAGAGEEAATAPALTPEKRAERIAELERRLAEPQRAQMPPALVETVRLEITVAPDARPGPRDLRLLARGVVSAPLVFVVGDLPEAAFPAVTATVPRPAAGSAKAVSVARAEVLSVETPVVVNGQILAGETDRIRFAGKRGQRLIVAVQARALTPYLADAVPGWFQAVAVLEDKDGRELAYADDFRFHPDPVLAYQLPADGDYTLLVRDALYRGREDFTYRVVIGEVPFVAGVFPLGGTVGGEREFALNGWNLPAPVRRARLPAETGETELELGRCAAATGAVRVAVDDLPEVAEQEPNDRPAEAQPVRPPVIVNGRIARPGDADWLRFEAVGGRALVVEAVARRLRSPLDGHLQVCAPDGTVLASDDDSADPADGLTTHQADPRLVFTPPADGTYLVRIGDAQSGGGHDHVYRLRLSEPRPDFVLRFVPSAVNLRVGGETKVTVHAARRDGFDGEIVIELRDAPAGLRLAAARIPAGEDKAEIRLVAGRDARAGVAPLRMEGVALIGGARVTRAAVPADDRMQAFFYRHLVPAQEGLVSVRGR